MCFNDLCFLKFFHPLSSSRFIVGTFQLSNWSTNMKGLAVFTSNQKPNGITPLMCFSTSTLPHFRILLFTFKPNEKLKTFEHFLRKRENEHRNTGIHVLTETLFQKNVKPLQYFSKRSSRR